MTYSSFHARFSAKYRFRAEDKECRAKGESSLFLAEEHVLPHKSPRIIAVGGGKGGVGKTCLSANIAIEIARKGWQVVVIDADLSCSNLELVLGLKADRRLDDFFLQKGAKDLNSVICDTNYENLRIVSGSTGLRDVANPKYHQKQALIREIHRIDADVVIVDLDAGAHLNTLDFYLMSDTDGILVINPEKTSIDNAFKFLRSALFRKIERFYKSPEVNILLRRKETLRSFIQSIREHPKLEERRKKQLCGEMIALAQSMKPKIIVNRARNAYEAQITSNFLLKSSLQYLMIEPEQLGHVPFDSIVPESVNSGVPFVVGYRQHEVSVCIADIVNRMGWV